MIAIKEKFTNLTDPLLRLVLKRPELLCRELMLEKLNTGDDQTHRITLQLIFRFLKITADYSLSYEKIVKICFDNASLVNALNARFKEKKKANTVVRLTLEEFENFINNYSHKDQRTVLNEIIDVKIRLNIANPVEQTKGTTRDICWNCK